jgi:hypothetical protein
MGVYSEVYDKTSPSLASLPAWKPDWIHPQDPLGWLQWYERYSGGRRSEDDQRQIKRWLSFRARHGGPFAKNPTPRRAYALRNWAINPETLLTAEQAAILRDRMTTYKSKRQGDAGETKSK